MCLIAIAYRVSERFPLLVAANRDERHERPTQAAHWWPGTPEILAGRDALAGGTWLAVDRAGRFAAVTNRPGPAPSPPAPSRGGLVVEFLARVEPAPGAPPGAADFEQRLAARAHRYAGFNLLLLDDAGLRCAGNDGRIRVLAPGVHAFSNDGWDSRWPKVVAAKRRLEAAAAAGSGDPADALFALLDDRTETGDSPVDASHAAFVVGGEYGTRSSTIVVVDADRDVRFVERSFDAKGARTGEVRHAFRATQSPV